tara:strand:+ start:442 stop:1227 length:786 start_codon:yes stop_codon:yes gene_type:complete
MKKNITKSYYDKGIMLFSFDTPDLEYSKITKKCIELLRIHCPDIPVVVVADEFIEGADWTILSEDPEPNIHNLNGPKQWKNLARVDAYELSPFDCTIVIDSDYLVYDNNLMKLFESDQSVLAHRSWCNLNYAEVSNMPMGNSMLDMMWATVLMFRKNTEVKQMFEHWRNVLKNYQYFAELFGVNKRMVRNDYAFTIAMAKMQDHGSMDHTVIPWDIVTANQNLEVKQITNENIVLEDQHGEIIVDQSVHILNKESLLNAIG